MRKIILMGSAAAIASMFAASAHAAAPKKDVSTYTIQCETVIATAGIKPVLSGTPSAVPTAVKIKGTLAGCTVTPDPMDPMPETIVIPSGKFGGTLTATSAGQNCLSLIAALPTTGDITVTWKFDKTNSSVAAIAQTKSIIHVTQLQGGIFQGPGSANNAVGEFTLSASGLTGAFGGSDGGSTSSIIGATSQSVVDLGGQCLPPGPGIKKINLGLGELTLQ